VMTDGRPLCCVCYERVYAAECATCQQAIHVTDGHMVHGSRRWHAADACFRCDSCACSLLGCPFVAIPGKDAIYCADCGVGHKTMNSTSYINKRDGEHCVSPSSPMMKVQELTGKAVRSKFEGAGSSQCSWHEESPVKVAVKFVSPHNSPLQSKPAAAELQSHSECMNSTSCCDDHRLSAEFEVCTSSLGEHHNNGILASQASSQNEKPLPCISLAKHSASDLRASAQTAECLDVNDTTADVSSMRPPALVAYGADCLDNADEINSVLEDLIVEPLWSRDEPNGLAAEGSEVVGVPDNIRQKSRKSKNLNVRFDPSTKDACSPVTHGVYCERWHPSSHRSLDDSDIPYMSRGSHCHGAGPNSSASVCIRRRRFGHGRHGGQNDIWSDVYTHGGRNHRAGMNRGSGWWADTGDDYEHCSTCSSSSSDSDFDYGDAAFSSRAVSAQSQTLPQRRRDVPLVGAAPLDQQVYRSRKHKKKHCVVS